MEREGGKNLCNVYIVLCEQNTNLFFFVTRSKKVRCYRFRVKLHPFKGWMYYFGISRPLIFNMAQTEWCSCPSKPCCSRPCPAATAVLLGEEQQAYMKTCDSRGIPNTTERVYRARDPLPRHRLRKQLQLPPMRSLQHCLSSPGLLVHLVRVYHWSSQVEMLTHSESVPCEQQTV